MRAGTRERRESVLTAALGCFTDLGLKTTTIQDIRRAAGCSIGSLYHHFGSKEGIAEELFIDGMKKFHSGLLDKVSQQKSARSSVKAVVFFYSEWVTQNQTLAQYLHSRDIDFSREGLNRIKDLHSEQITQTFEWFAPFVQSREMRRLPLECYIPIICGPVQEYTRRWLSDPLKQTPLDLQGVFADAAWRAIS